MLTHILPYLSNMNFVRKFNCYFLSHLKKPSAQNLHLKLRNEDSEINKMDFLCRTYRSLIQW